MCSTTQILHKQLLSTCEERCHECVRAADAHLDDSHASGDGNQHGREQQRQQQELERLTPLLLSPPGTHLRYPPLERDVSGSCASALLRRCCWHTGRSCCAARASRLWFSLQINFQT